MPVAVSTITQSGQISVPKAFRKILGVQPGDQLALLSDGERVQLVAVPSDPLTLGSEEQFMARVAKAEQEYREGKARRASEAVADLRDRYGL